MANVYALGAVKPNVRQAANDAGNLFGIKTIYGVAQRDYASDHPKGLALDFMVPGDMGKGDQVAGFFRQNAAKYGVTYVIWKQHIWNIGGSDHDMADRGGVTANHYDHVHVSFRATNVSNAAIIPGIPFPVPDLPGIPGIEGLQDLASFVRFIADPHNWLRVAMFVGGSALVILALILIAAGGQRMKNLTIRAPKVRSVA